MQYLSAIFFLLSLYEINVNDLKDFTGFPEGMRSTNDPWWVEGGRGKCKRTDHSSNTGRGQKDEPQLPRFDCAIRPQRIQHSILDPRETDADCFLCFLTSRTATNRTLAEGWESVR